MKKIAVILGLLVLMCTTVSFIGYQRVQNSPWGPALTLFADDTRVENFRSMDRIFPSKYIQPAADVWAFEDDPRPLPTTYEWQGEQHNIADFLARTETTGLLVAHDGQILHEAYYLGNEASSPATSWSMAKSFLSALVGIALEQGHIHSLDDAVTDYVPELRGSGYEDVPIKHVLTMSSGVAFDEDYNNPLSDVNMIFIRAFGLGTPMVDTIAQLERVREPGIYNDYISSDSMVLGLLLEKATGQPVADYLEEMLWQPVGMEAEAFWNLDRTGTEISFCCLNATLRDYARLGRLYLHEGQRDGVQIVPREWVIESVTPQGAHLEPGDNPDSFWTFGYGYQWWIPEEPDGDFLAIGVWGQYIYVYPRYNMVIVKSSADYWFDENDHETLAMLRAIARHYGEN